MRQATLKAEPLGEHIPRNPRLVLHGSGERAYLWIGNDAGFVGIAPNNKETRTFLKRALARMEKGLKQPRGRQR